MSKIHIEKFLYYKLKHVSKFFTPHFVVTVRVGFKANLICQMTSFQDINDLNLYKVCLLIWQAMQNDNELKWVFVLCYWGDLYTDTRTLQHSWNHIISPLKPSIFLCFRLTDYMVKKYFEFIERPYTFLLKKSQVWNSTWIVLELYRILWNTDKSWYLWLPQKNVFFHWVHNHPL